MPQSGNHVKFVKYGGLSVCIWRIETACETTADDIKELADSNQ